MYSLEYLVRVGRVEASTPATEAAWTSRGEGEGRAAAGAAKTAEAREASRASGAWCWTAALQAFFAELIVDGSLLLVTEDFESF